MAELEGKTAIVTGGATLIGVAVVRALHAAGAAVAVADIDEERGRGLADGLGERVLFESTDIRMSSRHSSSSDRAAIRRHRHAVNLAFYVDEGLASPRATGSSR